MTQWNDFDYELMDALEELPPPAETVAAVTPWHEAMSRITWGLVLLTFQLKFLYLDYLLPALGTALLYLGFRGLRQANRYFYFGWIISICKAILFYIYHILLAMPWPSEPHPIFTAFAALLTPLLYLSLWLGIRQASKTVGHPSVRQPALWALIWYGILTVFALRWPQPGWIPVLVLATLYLCILCSLRRVTKELALWGYDLPASPVHVSAERFRWLYLGSLALLVTLAAALSSHIVLDFVPVEESLPIDRLTELGLPEDVAAMMLPEDLESLANAVRYDREDYVYGNDQDNAHQNQIHSFLMPDGSVRAVHFFVPGDKGGFWQCHIKLESNARLTHAAARLFYTQNQQRMTANVAFHPAETLSGTDWFDMYFEKSVAASSPFSWPAFSKDRSVYVIYSADQESNPKTVHDELMHYRSEHAPSYPFRQENRSYDWAGGASFYYGNGSGLMYKADEIAREAENSP